MSAAVADFIAGQLALPTTSWSLGEFGALAEFHHLGESSLTNSTIDAAGASLAITPSSCTAVAYETISGRPDQWLHGIALCLPAAEARMNRRRVVSELGVDTRALLAEDRGAVLFDLGLGLTTVDFCVRTANPSLLMALRAGCGSALLENRPLFERLQHASPHRVLVSKLARLEVRAPIPCLGEHSPAGSHTHLLPHLLNRRVVHSANLPIPAQLLPCLYAYPAHPMQERVTGACEFDANVHDQFQALMKRFGVADQLDAKQELRCAVLGGEAPRPLRSAGSRHGRLAIRVALRQMKAQGLLPASQLHPWEVVLRKSA